MQYSKKLKNKKPKQTKQTKMQKKLLIPSIYQNSGLVLFL